MTTPAIQTHDWITKLLTEANGDRLEMWTVYDHPRDLPEWFVARKFVVTPAGPQPTTDVMLFKTLQSVRDYFETHTGLVRLSRFEEDEPQIVEVWL